MNARRAWWKVWPHLCLIADDVPHPVLGSVWQCPVCDQWWCWSQASDWEGIGADDWERIPRSAVADQRSRADYNMRLLHRPAGGAS